LPACIAIDGPAADATVVDTQGLSPEQVAGVIVKLAKEVDCR
jgi:cytidylate kinase